MPVSDAEVKAVLAELCRRFGVLTSVRRGDAIGVLEAAARVREEAELERTRGIMKALHVESLREKR